jgi:hypothetical protein
MRPEMNDLKNVVEKKTLLPHLRLLCYDFYKVQRPLPDGQASQECRELELEL